MNAEKLKPLPSVAFAVDELFDGTNECARFLTHLSGIRVTKQTVSTWKTKDHFPPDWMTILAPLIIARGYEPQPRHFNQKEPQ